jgi:hypothetical protein
MLDDVAALLEFLKNHKIHYCMIGGMAVLAYGGRASTLDFDFYLLSSDFDRLVKLLKDREIRVLAAGEDQCKARFGALPLDILRADPWLGEGVVRRARRRKFLGKTARIATPEDLIIMKTLADRPIDRRDIAELREIFGDRLDEKYVNAALRRVKKALR